MNPTSLVVPFERLPPGYARTLGPPPDPPVTPRPAATLALLRKGCKGPEVLLLRRSHRTRFIPGAFVFPGGRVDEGDTSPQLQRLLEGLSPDEANARLGISDPSLPGVAFWIAALRETFEETGVVLGGGTNGVGSVSLEDQDRPGRLRRDLQEGVISFVDVLKELGVVLGLGGVSYFGHWVTPVQERYRYDTRFFAAEIPPDCPVFPDGVELVESLWLTPTEALDRNREGGLPLVFPTLFTLRALQPFKTPGEALEALGGEEIPRLLPRVEETEDGVRMVLEGLPPTHSFTVDGR